MKLPGGIIPVLQTPFSDPGSIDFESLERLVVDALEGEADGFLVPGVAGEVHFLLPEERTEILKRVLAITRGSVPVVVGASDDDPCHSRKMASEGMDLGARAVLIAVPQQGYLDPRWLIEYFQAAIGGLDIPLLIQDLEFNGPGLSLESMRSLADALPQLVGWKIETVPSGPKYSSVRDEFGDGCHISGGWAVPQFIEALDRGVDAMIPETSMVRLYQAVRRKYLEGDRSGATSLFRRLLPILSFANQEIRTSIAFFKRLLVKKKIFTCGRMRWQGFEWDACNTRIADELIELYLELELSLKED